MSINPLFSEDIREHLKKEWNEKISSSPSLIVHDDGFAKLGDAYVNFAYSLAKSTVLGEPTGCKVPDTVLSNAYRNSNLTKMKKLDIRGRKGQIGDSIEGLLLWAWLTEVLPLDNLVVTLRDNLAVTSFIHSRTEAETATKAFSVVLDQLAQLLEQEDES